MGLWGDSGNVDLVDINSIKGKENSEKIISEGWVIRRDIDIWIKEKE